MSYIAQHRVVLEARHYITLATTRTYWFNFYESKLRDFINLYEEEFCVVINGSEDSNDAYILPFGKFKEFFFHTIS